MDIVIGFLLGFGLPALLIYGIIKLVKKSSKKVKDNFAQAKENINNVPQKETINNEELNSQIKEALKDSIKVTIRATSSVNDDEIKNYNTFGELTGDSINGWVVNNGSPFSLTVIHPDKDVAISVKDILENKTIYFGEKRRELIKLFAAKNVVIKEIEDYKKKFKAIYLENIEKEIRNSEEWDMLGNKDRDDILVEFKSKAIQQLPIRPNCNLEILFNYEPTDITIDDDLIEEYGFDTVEFYLWKCDNFDKIYTAESGTDYRRSFEELVEKGLAIQGENIPLEEVLTNLTLKQLNSIANNDDKEYKRKAQAIEYILNNNNSINRIKNVVSFRELFKLLPLPMKYSEIDLSKISTTFQYHKEEAEILINTFNTCINYYEATSDIKIVKSFNINNSANQNECPCCLNSIEKEIPVELVPVLPHHIGCCCWLRTNLDYEKMKFDFSN